MANIIGGSIGAGKAILNDYTLGVEDIDGGHRLTITRGSEVQTIDIMDGKNGAPGAVQTVNGEAPDENGNVEVQAGVQSDWNQNDETAIDYVKNRPFYKELRDVIVIPEQTPILMDDQHGKYLYGITVQDIPNPGDEATITLGDQHYICTVTPYDDDLMLGNGSIIGGPDTGEPFVIFVGNSSLLSLSPIDETLSCTAKSLVHNSVPMEYLDNAAKTVRIDSDSITLERAKEIIGINPDLIIWNRYTFKSFGLSITSTDGSNYTTKLVLYDIYDSVYYASSNENDEFNINTSVESSYGDYPLIHAGLKSYISANKCIKIASSHISTGDATEDAMFRIGNDGVKKRKEFKVLGNGTVEAYSIILPSTTAGSTKNFRITVDDSGTLTATEVT